MNESLSGTIIATKTAFFTSGRSLSYWEFWNLVQYIAVGSLRIFGGGGGGGG